MIQSNFSIATQARLTVLILTKRIRIKRAAPRALRRALRAQHLAPQNARPVRSTPSPVRPASAHALGATPVSEPRTWDPLRNRGAPSHPGGLLPRRSAGPPLYACHAHRSILRPHPLRPAPPRSPHVQPCHALSVSDLNLRPSKPAPTHAYHRSSHSMPNGPHFDHCTSLWSAIHAQSPARRPTPSAPWRTPRSVLPATPHFRPAPPALCPACLTPPRSTLTPVHLGALLATAGRNTRVA